MDGQCARKPFNADNLERIITDDAKKFLVETDVEKLLVSHKDIMKEKEQELLVQLKRIAREISQAEKELAKFKEEVYKVIIGESQFSQNLLSELIQTKESELTELRKRHEDVEIKVDDIRAIITSQRSVCADLSDWVERFDMQDTMEKKSMLINLIERITIYEEEIAVKYRIRFDEFEGKEYNESIDKEINNQNDVNIFLSEKCAKRSMLARILD